MHLLANQDAEFVDILGLAFPDNQYTPPHFSQQSSVLLESNDVAAQLLRPVVLVAFRNRSPSAAFVSMPEAPVDEHHSAVFGQDNVRIAWQVTAMYAESKTLCMQRSPNADLRCGVLALDPRHDAASLLDGEHVCNH